MSFKLEDFDVLEFIGKGSFASCFKIRNKHTNEVLVWKVIEYGEMPEDKKQLLVTEVSLLRDLCHPHIVRYYDRIICNENKRLYIIIEFCPGGDLATLIKTCKRSLSFVDENFVWRVLHQLGSALHACHSWLSSSVVLHRDIKPANVFLDDKGNIKLGDFGLACKLDVGQIGCVEMMVGTPFYMSPEVIRGEMYNSKSDVWSLGCLVYELCALTPPFNAQNIKDLAAKVSKGRFPRIPLQYSDGLQRILSCLLTVNQEERPSIFDVVCHPEILSHLNESLELTSAAIALPNPPLQLSNSKSPSPIIGDRDPQKVSMDTFRGEWMARLQVLRDREAALRCREQQLDEREHSVSRKEHKVALMERMVRDKMVLAEIYLRRCRDSLHQGGPSSGPSVGIREQRSQVSEEIDDSFSADPGDTSIMPTSTYLDPTQLSKPWSLFRAPPTRRVHFDDDQIQATTSIPSSQSKPLCLKVAEAIRNNKGKLDTQSRPKVQQKVLHFPGYTGPAITVNVPIEDSEKRNCVSSPEEGSPSIKLTVLFDDREDLQKATINNEEKLTSFDSKTKQISKTSVKSLGVVKQFSGPHGNDTCDTKIVSSIGSTLDASQTNKVNSCLKTAKSEKVAGLSKGPLSFNQSSFKKNVFGGSLRSRNKTVQHHAFSSLRSHPENSSLDNVKNDALFVLQKDNQNKHSCRSNRNSVSSVKGKENMPARETTLQVQHSIVSAVDTNAICDRLPHSLFLR